MISTKTTNTKSFYIQSICLDSQEKECNRVLGSVNGIINSGSPAWTENNPLLFDSLKHATDYIGPYDPAIYNSYNGIFLRDVEVVLIEKNITEETSIVKFKLPTYKA